MFNGYAGLTLAGDHLDLSYHDWATWPAFTPGGSIRMYGFDIGDETAGSTIMLGVTQTVDSETLDWKHSIDPIHHHGTDQLRLCSRGGWVVAGKPLKQGEYGFQESGWVYQEHPGGPDPAWMLLLMGDRRGSQPTIKLEKDKQTLIKEDALEGAFAIPDFDNPKPYPHPAGDKGIAAILTTAGSCQRGYLSGVIGESDAGASLTGLLGDAEVGPAVHMLKAVAGDTMIPSCRYATEVVIAIVQGSCRIGETEYGDGVIRIQRAGAHLDAVVAGPKGCEMAVIVADRRAQPILDEPADGTAWMREVDHLRRELEPVPGGAAGLRLRAATQA